RHTRFSRDWSSDVCSSDLSWSRAARPARRRDGGPPRCRGLRAPPPLPRRRRSTGGRFARRATPTGSARRSRRPSRRPRRRTYGCARDGSRGSCRRRDHQAPDGCNYRWARMAVNADPKPGRWILPLVVLGMVAFTYFFVRALPSGSEPGEETGTTLAASDTTVPADGEESPDDTTPATSPQ